MMTRANTHSLTWLWLGVLLMQAQTKIVRAGQDTLSEILQAARKPRETVVFHAPPQPHFEAVREVAALLTKAAASCDDAARKVADGKLRPIALEVSSLSADGQVYWVIRETPPTFRGSGVYALRCGEAVPLVVQIPHSFFDTHTGRVGRVIFKLARARWLFLNTLHRYKGRAGEKQTDSWHPADCAHNPALFFQAMTEGVLAAEPAALFAQLHGFDATSRGTEVILSDGHRGPQVWAERVKSLWTLPEAKVVVFERNMRELGGLTNVQGDAIAAKKGRFVHIEMSLPIRTRLSKEAAAQKNLAAALGQASQDKEPTQAN